DTWRRRRNGGRRGQVGRADARRHGGRDGVPRRRWWPLQRAKAGAAVMPCAAAVAVYVVPGFSRTLLAQQPPQPAFKSSVEVTSLDVTVVDTNGKPITNLTPADFVVRIDNNVRRVVTAEWVQLTSGDEKPAVVVTPPEGYSTNENSIGGRLIVMAIDQPNIRFGGAMAIARAANAFVD